MNDIDNIQVATYRVNGFYFEQLDVDEQMEYKRIASAVAHYAPTAEIEATDSIKKICSAIQLDNPELFYWNVGKTGLHDGKLELKYTTTEKRDAEGLVHKVRHQVRRDIVEKLMNEKENVDKKEFLKKIYFYLCNNNRYADEEFEKKKPRAWLYTIQGALLNGMGTSLSLALALNYLLEIGGIDTILMTGTVLRNGKTVQNAWNLVRLDGKYYHIDAGSQMMEKTDDPEAYFLLKDENLKELGYEWSAEVYPQA